MEEVDRAEIAPRQTAKSVLIAASVIFMGPIGLLFVWLWRREWLKKAALSVPIIAWSILYIIGAMNMPTQEEPPTTVKASEMDEPRIERQPSQAESADITVEDGDDNTDATSESAQAATSENVSPATDVVENPTTEQTYTVPNPPSEKQTNDTESSNTGNPDDTSANENIRLPLKAICADGTISYQDSPELSTYRGMCSGHGGIKERLGRVE